jgi:hypothetical protein
VKREAGCKLGIHINVNFDKYCQLFEYEADWQQVATQKGAVAQNKMLRAVIS